MIKLDAESATFMLACTPGRFTWEINKMLN